MTARTVSPDSFEEAVQAGLDEGLGLLAAVQAAASNLGLPVLPPDLLEHSTRSGQLVDVESTLGGVLGFDADGQLCSVGTLGEPASAVTKALIRGIDHGYRAPVVDEEAEPIEAAVPAEPVAPADLWDEGDGPDEEA